MKKIFVMFILSLGVMGILAGCGKKDDGDEGSDKSTPTPEVTSEDDKKEDNEVDYEEDDEEDDDVDKGIGIGGEDMANFTPEENPVIKEDYDYNDYIKLGKYKGIEVKIDKMEVTDDYLDANIQIDLLSNAITPIEVTNRAVRHADTVNIDYVGYHKGEPFDGGADQGYDLTIGSKTFIEGFEEQLIGVEADGKEIDINVVFPKNYNNATLAGEPVVFKVKVNSIKYIEITDDLIKESMGFDNEEAYRESFREQIIASIADGATRQKENDVYTAVINGAEITIPDNLLEYYESDIKTLYTNSAAMYGTTLENFIMQSNSTMEEFEAYAQYYSNNMATRELILKAISTAEGIELTEEEFQSEVTQYAEQYGYESNEQFLEEADEEVLREDLLFYKVIEFLVAESIEI